MFVEEPFSEERLSSLSLCTSFSQSTDHLGTVLTNPLQEIRNVFSAQLLEAEEGKR